MDIAYFVFWGFKHPGIVARSYKAMRDIYKAAAANVNSVGISHVHIIVYDTVFNFSVITAVYNTRPFGGIGKHNIIYIYIFTVFEVNKLTAFIA